MHACTLKHPGLTATGSVFWSTDRPSACFTMVASVLPSTTLPLTSLYGGAVGVLFALLSLRAFLYRGAKGPKAYFGDQNIPEAPQLQSIVRSQGNLAEYYAAFFVLFGLLEFNKVLGASGLNILGLVFLTARVSHAFQFTNPQKRPVLFRAYGFLGTFVSLAVVSFLNAQYGYSNK